MAGWGTLSTNGSTNVADCGSTTSYAACTGSTITAFSGQLFGQSVSLVASPNPPAIFQGGDWIGDNQLISSSPTYQLDAYGIIFQSAAGSGNIYSNSGYENSPYHISGINYGAYIAGPNYSYLGDDGNFVATLASVVTSAAGGAADNPTLLGTQISGINGSIGPTDSEQFYTFAFGGGAFSTSALISGASADDSFIFDLARIGGGFGETVTLDEANGFAGTLGGADLPAGQYTVGLFADVPVDPDFTISFSQLVSGVPEPANWMAFILGFGLIGGMVRRRGAVALRC